MMKTIITIFTTSKKVKETLQELELKQVIGYVEEEEDSEIVLKEHIHVVGTSTEEMVFQLIHAAEQKAAYMTGKHLVAYLEALSSFNTREYILGSRDDFSFIASGRLIEHVRQAFPKEKTENEVDQFKEKLGTTKERGRGMIFAYSDNLIRSNNYCMALEEKYPNVDLILCASSPKDGEEEAIEAFIFQ